MAGNIVKLQNGRYRLRYKDESKYIKAKSDREAERLLAAFVTDVDSGDFTKGSKVTLNEFVKKWLKEYAEIELAPKTVYRYKQLLDARILKAFGSKKLDRIRPLEIVEFYNSLRKEHKYMRLKPDGSGEWEEALSEPLAEQTIKHHHRLISALFEKAIKWEVFKGTNPAKRVDAPKTEKKKAKCYDLDMVNKMVEALEGEELRNKVAIMLTLTTGVRLSELMGFEWGDIDKEKRTIEVTRESQYIPEKGTFTKDYPKNDSSNRRITLSKFIMEMLEEYKADQQGKGFMCQDNNRLFVGIDGLPMHPYYYTKWFPKFIRKHNERIKNDSDIPEKKKKALYLPRLNFHGLRHTSATFLISQGMDIETVAGRLGHSTSATTQNVYSHFLESKDKKAADMMEKTFNKKRVKTIKSKKGIS